MKILENIYLLCGQSYLLVLNSMNGESLAHEDG